MRVLVASRYPGLCAGAVYSLNNLTSHLPTPATPIKHFQLVARELKTSVRRELRGSVAAPFSQYQEEAESGGRSESARHETPRRGEDGETAPKPKTRENEPDFE